MLSFMHCIDPSQQHAIHPEASREAQQALSVFLHINVPLSVPPGPLLNCN